MSVTLVCKTFILCCLCSHNDSILNRCDIDAWTLNDVWFGGEDAIGIL